MQHKLRSPRHLIHTTDPIHEDRRLGPARSVNLAAPPSRPATEHLNDCHCPCSCTVHAHPAVQIQPTFIHRVQYMYTRSSTEQTYSSQLTFHLYRMSIQNLHGGRSVLTGIRTWGRTRIEKKNKNKKNGGDGERAKVGDT